MLLSSPTEILKIVIPKVLYFINLIQIDFKRDLPHEIDTVQCPRQKSPLHSFFCLHVQWQVISKYQFVRMYLFCIFQESLA